MLLSKSVTARAALLFFVSLCLLAPGGAHAAPGDLDPGFGDGGAKWLHPDGYERASGSGAVTAVRQPDGKTLFVGTSRGTDLSTEDKRVTFMRLTGDGQVDTSYGDGGVLRLPAAYGRDLEDAVGLPDGDVVLLTGQVGTDWTRYGLARINPDGTPDASFGGGDGLILTGYDAFSAPKRTHSSASGRVLSLQGADRLVVAASLVSYNDQYNSSSFLHETGIARYDLAGDLDLAFGTTGATILAPAEGHQAFGNIRGLAAEPAGGKLLVVEEFLVGTSERVGLHRLDEDGTPDATFGTGGVVIPRMRPDVADTDTVDVSERGEAVLALPGGDIAVAGGAVVAEQHKLTKQAGAIVRLDAQGDPVAGFGSGGVVLAGDAEGWRSFTALALVGGAIYAAGTTQGFDESGQPAGWQSTRVWLARAGDAGLDASFGRDGLALGAGLHEVHDLLDAGNGFVLMASQRNNGDAEWAAARHDIQDSRQPVNAERPRVEGPHGDLTVGAGETATAHDGAWHYGAELTRRWQRCPEARQSEAPATDGNCADIPSATGRTYVVQDADKGKHLRVVVTNTSGQYTATAASHTADVPDPATPPAFTSGPDVTPAGMVPAGTTVRAKWAASGTQPLTAEVRWFRCPTATDGPCAPVPSDDTADDAYETSSGDVGSYMRAIVALKGKGGYVSKETANATGVSADTGQQAPKATSAPTIAPGGSVTEGTTLERTSDGQWDQGDLLYGHRWERCDGDRCSAIPGAASASYTTTAADAGRSVRLVVEARHGDGPVGTSASPATAVTAKPAPKPEPKPKPKPEPEVKPANPFGLTGTVTHHDTTVTKAMPDVRGLQVDAAKQRIEDAGIHAKIDVVEAIRAKPLKLPGKSRLDIGDVSGQSLSGGTQVTSGIGTPKPIRLVTEAGPKATKANGGPFGPVCTGKAARADFKGLGLGEVLDLLKAKKCTRVEVDYKVSASAKEVEVRKAVKDGKELELQVTVPADPARLDLTAAFRQGAFNGRPSFGLDDWALTADAMNIMGIQVINRAGTTIEDADIFVDASKVGADDLDGSARGGVYVTGFKPTKAGIVNVLVSQRDSAGNRIFGFGWFSVVDRRAPFTSIDGRRYTQKGALAAGGARAAGISEVLAALGHLAQSLGAGVSNLFSGVASEQTISTAAKQNVGLIQLSLGNILSGLAGVIAPGGANVVASGGANAVASGGANVVAAGGLNMISIASGNAVAAGGLNLLGKETMKNGTGELRHIPAEVVAPGGANVIAPGGANVVAGGGANVLSTYGSG